MDVALSVLNKLTSKYENLLVALDAKGECEVDDFEWVRYFTRHGVLRPAKARLISPIPPQPQGLPRHPRWRGRQGPHGASQGSSRTPRGRPQPHTQGAAPHTILPRSSTPDGFPAERSTNKCMRCYHTNTKTAEVRMGQLSMRDCESTLHTPPSTLGIIAATPSISSPRQSVQRSPGTIQPSGLKPLRPPSCRGVYSPLAPCPDVGFSTDLRCVQSQPARMPEAPPGLPCARRTPFGPSGTTPTMTVMAAGLKPFRPLTCRGV